MMFRFLLWTYLTAMLIRATAATSGRQAVLQCSECGNISVKGCVRFKGLFIKTVIYFRLNWGDFCHCMNSSGGSRSNVQLHNIMR